SRWDVDTEPGRSPLRVRLGHSAMSARCPVCPKADMAGRFIRSPARGLIVRKCRYGLPHGVKPSLRLVDGISPFGHRFLAIRFYQRLAKAAHCQPSIRPFWNIVRALTRHFAPHRLKAINCSTARCDARLFQRLQSASSNLLVILGPSGHPTVTSVEKNNAESGCGRVVPAPRRKLRRVTFGGAQSAPCALWVTLGLLTISGARPL